MIKPIKYLLTLSIIMQFGNSYSQNINLNEREQIEATCREKIERMQTNTQIMNAFENTILNTEAIMNQCMQNALEIAFFNSYNTIEDTQDLYKNTVRAIQAKLNEYRNSSDNETSKKFLCFIWQIFALTIAARAEEKFLKRALITANNLLVRDCKKVNE
jgi:hypothetical protein